MQAVENSKRRKLIRNEQIAPSEERRLLFSSDQFFNQGCGLNMLITPRTATEQTRAAHRSIDRCLAIDVGVFQVRAFIGEQLNDSVPAIGGGTEDRSLAVGFGAVHIGTGLEQEFVRDCRRPGELPILHQTVQIPARLGRRGWWSRAVAR